MDTFPSDQRRPWGSWRYPSHLLLCWSGHGTWETPHIPPEGALCKEEQPLPRAASPQHVTNAEWTVCACVVIRRRRLGLPPGRPRLTVHAHTQVKPTYLKCKLSGVDCIQSLDQHHFLPPWCFFITLKGNS